MFQINEVIDSTYQIINEIGRGGTGIVFLAYHLRLEKYVVIKKIKDNFVNIVDVRSEVDILKKLHHKYLPQVYDFVSKGKNVYTVIDYVEGYDLEYYKNIDYQFTEEEIVKWLKQMCEVLNYLHSQKPMILHSDIKPSNIMIDKNGDICLIDFNISLNSESQNNISGLSQYYASPEQVEKVVAFVGKSNSQNVNCEYFSQLTLDQRTDIYSLGATFYYLISGIRPYIDIREFQNYIIYGLSNNWDFVNTFPMGVEIPATYLATNFSVGLLFVIEKAMCLNTNGRFSNTEEMLSELNALRKKEKNYVIARMIRYSSILIYSIFLSIGIIFCVDGARKSVLQNFQDEISEFNYVFNSGNNNEAISLGAGILNNDRYTNILANEKNEKAVLLHNIGDCFYYMEAYSDSLQYYREAYEIMKSSSEEIYFRDYAIALAKSGGTNVNNAEKILNEVMLKNPNWVSINVVQAEILYEEKKYDEAVEILSRVTSSVDATNRDKSISYMILADIEESNSNISNSIDMYEKAYEIESENKNNARRLAYQYVSYVEKYSQMSKELKNSYYFKAKKIYEELVNMKYATIEDKINLAATYRLINEANLLEKAENLLKNELSRFEDYRIYIELSYVYINMRDYSRAQNSYEKAIRTYNRQNDRENMEMRRIQEIKNLLGD